jgi:hypothetical protein
MIGALLGILLAGLFAPTICLADSMLTVKSVADQGANDSVNWSQLGADATSLGTGFSATSGRGLSVNVSLAAPGSLVSVACPASPCSWNGTGFNADDSLVWTSGADKGGNGPLNASMSSPVSGIGAFIEADGPAQFTAQLQVFNGATSLGSFTVTSDSSGDAVYVGAKDQSGAHINSATFSITSCNGSCADFAIDTMNLNVAGASTTPTATATPTPGPTPTSTGSATPTPTATPEGRIRVNKNSVTLTARVNHQASTNVKIINRGVGMLQGSVSGPAGSPFSSAGTGPFTFSPGGDRKIKVTFSPTVKGTFKAVLTITSDDPLRPSINVPITGIATGGGNVPSADSGADSAIETVSLNDPTIASPTPTATASPTAISTPATAPATAIPTSTKTAAASAKPSAPGGWYIPVRPYFGGPVFNIGPWPSLLECNDMDGSFMYSHPFACHLTGLPADCGIVGNGAGYPAGTPYPPLAEDDPQTRIMGGCFWSNTITPTSSSKWYFLEYHALPVPGGSMQACGKYKHFKRQAKKDPAHYKLAVVTHACGGPCWPVGIDNACQ